MLVTEGSPGPYKLLLDPDDHEALIAEITRGIISKAVLFRNKEGNLTFEDIEIEEVPFAMSPDDIEEGAFSQPEEEPRDH